MSDQRKNALWGAFLIILGGLFLVETLGFLPAFAPLFWVVSFGLVSLFFAYLFWSKGSEEWWWLIPMCVTAGLALTVLLGMTAANGLWTGALFMGFVSLPFWLIYLLKRQEHWWALIPAWVTAVLTLIILVSERWSGEMIGALLMWGIALPFIVIYVRNQEHWWALIPGFVMTAMGVVILLASRGPGVAIGAFMMLMLALPFFAVFFFAEKQWWALIPAGIFTTLALIIPLAAGYEETFFGERLVATVLFLGFATPFAWLWWRSNRYPTNWAKYPAVGLVIVALAALALGSTLADGWPLIFILIGGWLLVDNVRQPTLKS